MLPHHSTSYTLATFHLPSSHLAPSFSICILNCTLNSSLHTDILPSQSSPRPSSPVNSPAAAMGGSTGRPSSPTPPGGPKTAIRRRAAADQKDKLANARPSSTRAAGAGGSSSTMLSMFCLLVIERGCHCYVGVGIPSGLEFSVCMLRWQWWLGGRFEAFKCRAGKGELHMGLGDGDLDANT
jgi:hypothetical protein